MAQWFHYYSNTISRRHNTGKRFQPRHECYMKSHLRPHTRAQMLLSLQHELAIRHESYFVAHQTISVDTSAFISGSVLCYQTISLCRINNLAGCSMIRHQAGDQAPKLLPLIRYLKALATMQSVLASTSTKHVSCMESTALAIPDWDLWSIFF